MHAGFDGSMHIDVGDAFLQLGLPDEALRSYRLAAEDPSLACAASLCIARVSSAQGDWNEATRWLCSALMHPLKTPQQEAELLQELSRTPTPPPTGSVSASPTPPQGSLDDDLDAAFDLTFG